MSINYYDSKYVDWFEVENMIKYISHKIIDSGFKPSFVVPIPKGGWTVASLLAQHLSIKKYISISQTKSGDFRKTFVVGTPKVEGETVLVVEDSIETAKSLFDAKTELSNLGAIVRTATLYISPNFKGNNPDYYFEIGKIPVFPWEKEYNNN